MKRKFNEPMAGDVFDFAYPFVLGEAVIQDEEGSAIVPSWRPGVKDLVRGDDRESVADAMGAQIVTVIGTFRPAPFPMRVFFTRKWRDPTGKEFGKRGCRVVTINAFRGIIGGYRHAFRMASEAGAMPMVEVGAGSDRE